MGETAQALFKEVAPAHRTPHAKVTVVGVGQVGMACVVSIMQKVCHFPESEIVIVMRFYKLI